MKYRLDDTQLEMLAPAVIDALRRKSASKRVATIVSTNCTTRLLLEGYVRSQYPNWIDTRMKRETARKMLRGPGYAAAECDRDS